MSYIRRRVAAAAGYSLLTLNSAQQERLDDIINEAAEEIWDSTDLPGSLMEVSLRVTADKQLALPNFVGELRAMREHFWESKWDLQDQRPRYQNQPWKNQWKNWRIIGFSPIQRTLVTTGAVTLTIPVADATVSITIVGSTVDAARVSETFVMSATSVAGTIQFTSYTSIHANSDTRNSNISVVDQNNNVLAILRNDQREVKYLIVDVSQYPSTGSLTDGTRLMDVLYKIPYSKLINDNDVFPVPDFDNVIILRAKQLIEEGKESDDPAEKALLLNMKANNIQKRKTENIEGTTQKRMQFTKNPLLGMYDVDDNWRYYHCPPWF